MFILEEVKLKKVRAELVDAIAKQKITKEVRANAVIIAGDTLTAI